MFLILKGKYKLLFKLLNGKSLKKNVRNIHLQKLGQLLIVCDIFKDYFILIIDYVLMLLKRLISIDSLNTNNYPDIR